MARKNRQLMREQEERERMNSLITERDTLSREVALLQEKKDALNKDIQDAQTSLQEIETVRETIKKAVQCDTTQSLRDQGVGREKHEEIAMQI